MPLLQTLAKKKIAGKFQPFPRGEFMHQSNFLPERIENYGHVIFPRTRGKVHQMYQKHEQAEKPNRKLGRSAINRALASHH